MTYLYRHDPWSARVQMDGDDLRARYWSTSKKSFRHAPLMAAEITLDQGQGIFAIWFWKSEAAMLVSRSGDTWNEPWVLQRVRADHPFLASFIQDVDDHQPDRAWMYWKKDRRNHGQEWSVDGIPASDIEVMDWDGSWRPSDQSEILRPEMQSFRRLGFEPFHYLDNGRMPALVFAKERFMEIGSETQFAILLAHPLAQVQRIYKEQKVLEHVLETACRRAPGVPLHKFRLYIMDDAPNSCIPVHLVEMPVQQRRVIKTKQGRLFGLFPLSIIEPARQIELGKPIYHGPASDTFRAVTKAFLIPLVQDRMARYRNIHSTMQAVAASMG